MKANAQRTTYVDAEYSPPDIEFAIHWKEKNATGFMRTGFNGLGHDHYARADV